MATDQGQRSTLKEFLASISTIRGDLSNITAPPFLLHTQSTVEFPSYWAERPNVFVAPAAESDPQKRALLVLRWFLAALKRQQFAGRDEKDGVKKPLNAFLGEIFLGGWNDEEAGETRIIGEQVSHHPPITACFIWNDKHGVKAEGYACQNITFSGSVNIKQFGHAIVHLDEYNEDYLIPLPNVKVSGLLTGSPYPELQGSYSIVSSSGYIAEIDFSGKKMLGLSGQKNHVHAALFRTDDTKRKSPVYEVEGAWNDSFVIKDVSSNTDIETYDVNNQPITPLQVPPLNEQDPWESRRAWAGVIEALNKGNMQAVSDAKSIVEEAQRAKRRKEEAEGKKFAPLFFVKQEKDEVFQKLAAETGGQHSEDGGFGFWKFNPDTAAKARKPFRGDVVPWEDNI